HRSLCCCCARTEGLPSYKRNRCRCRNKPNSHRRTEAGCGRWPRRAKTRSEEKCIFSFCVEKYAHLVAAGAPCLQLSPSENFAKYRNFAGLSLALTLE